MRNPMVGRWPSALEKGVEVAVRCSLDKARAIDRELKSGRNVPNAVNGFLVWEGERPFATEVHVFWVVDARSADAFVGQLKGRGVSAKVVENRPWKKKGKSTTAP